MMTLDILVKIPLFVLFGVLAMIVGNFSQHWFCPSSSVCDKLGLCMPPSFCPSHPEIERLRALTDAASVFASESALQLIRNPQKLSEMQRNVRALGYSISHTQVKKEAHLVAYRLAQLETASDDLQYCGLLVDTAAMTALEKSVMYLDEIEACTHEGSDENKHAVLDVGCAKVSLDFTLRDFKQLEQSLKTFADDVQTYRYRVKHTSIGVQQLLVTMRRAKLQLTLHPGLSDKDVVYKGGFCAMLAMGGVLGNPVLVLGGIVCGVLLRGQNEDQKALSLVDVKVLASFAPAINETLVKLDEFHAQVTKWQSQVRNSVIPYELLTNATRDTIEEVEHLASDSGTIKKAAMLKSVARLKQKVETQIHHIDQRITRLIH